MPLTELPTELVYETSTDKLIEEFYGPALRRSKYYDRGVGFFTSNWLRLASAGLAQFAENNGKARLLVSVHLERKDANAIERGVSALHDSELYGALTKAVDELEVTLEKDTLSALAWMVADGVIHFRVASPREQLDGDFHDKFGIFSDDVGNSVGFAGSQNDSDKAFRNYESIRVDYSWASPRENEAIEVQKRRFRKLWEGLDPNLASYEMPEAILKRIVQLRDSSRRPYSINTPNAKEDKWRHQDEASRAFIAAKHGILEMATGTGKTKTAISILKQLLSEQTISSVVVTTSGTDLLDQWYQQLIRVPNLSVWRHFRDYRQLQMFLTQPSNSVLLISREFLAKHITKIPSAVKAKTLFIADEVHGLGSSVLRTALAGKLPEFAYRLGLSATPEREYDDDGNDFIVSAIGPVLYKFPLEKAIARGILCELDYIPLEYSFSKEDTAQIKRITAAYHARSSSKHPMTTEEFYQQIARVRKLSLEKLPPFEAYIKSNPSLLDRSLIFVETAEYGLRVQHAIHPIVGTYHTYYGTDDRSNLAAFARGSLDTLITCHRISEGIDIRSVKSIVLFASSRARLETIQRLGRSLRTDPAQPEKRATVIDFIRTDDLGSGEPTVDSERRDWLEGLASIKHQQARHSAVATS